MLNVLCRIPLVLAIKISQSVPKSRWLSQGEVQKRISRHVIESLLNINAFTANTLLGNKKLGELSEELVRKNHELCVINGVKNSSIVEQPLILGQEDLEKKIEDLKKLKHDVNTTVALCCLNWKQFRFFLHGELEENRLTSLANLFKITEKEVCFYISKRPFLASLDLKHVAEAIELLKKYSITLQDILKDLWVLKYSTDTIKLRLEQAKENNIEEFKTWMVRVQPDIFENYIRRRTDKKSILGNNSLVEYLSAQLDCTEDVAKYLIRKQPALKNKSLKKMQEIIDFLYSSGFKPIHICKMPKILLHSVVTIRKRLKELESLDMHLDSLCILTKSSKQYLQYYHSLTVKKAKK